MPPYGHPVFSVIEVPGADLYRSVFLTYLSAGVAVALAILSLGVFRFRAIGQIFCLLVAFLAVWASLIFGVGAAFDAWQGMVNPPDEAFADGAQLTGSVMFGWMASAPACALAWLILTGVKQYFWPNAGAKAAD